MVDIEKGLSTFSSKLVYDESFPWKNDKSFYQMEGKGLRFFSQK